MKKLFLLTAVAALFFSCQKEPGVINGGNDVGEKATLKVKLNQPTRAEGANPDTYVTDMNILNATVFVLDANDVILSKGSLVSPFSDIDLVTTTAARKVFVVANFVTGVSVGATFAELKESMICSLAHNGTPPAGESRIDKTEGSVWSSGEADLGAWTTLNTNEDAYTQDIAVQVRPVSSKLNINVNVSELYGAKDGTFKFSDERDGIMVLNAVSSSNIAGATPFVSYTAANYPWLVPATKAYYSAIAMGGFEIPNTSSVIRNFLFDDMTSLPTTGAIQTKPYHYYVFENDADRAEDKPTIVTIRGTWGMDLDPDSPLHFTLSERFTRDMAVAVAAKLAPKTLYFALHMTSMDAGAAGIFNAVGSGVAEYGKGVQRGKAYNIGLTLSDKVFTGIYDFPELPIDEDPGGNYPPDGPDDPTKPIVKAELEVTVTLVPWIPVAVDKTW